MRSIEWVIARVSLKTDQEQVGNLGGRPVFGMGQMIPPVRQRTLGRAATVLVKSSPASYKGATAMMRRLNG
jgi:hypothetical protein